MDPVAPEDEPSSQLIEQRVRNRLIDYFSWASSFSEQLDYQATVPTVSVVNEVIEQWYDWAPDTFDASSFGAVYSADEVATLMAYQSVMLRAIERTPGLWEPMDSFHALPVWQDLRLAAEEAREIFARRGSLPEDSEV